MSRQVRLRLDLKGDEVRKFHLLQKRLGLKNSTEVIRFLIHREAQKIGPEMEHYNLNEEGVRILDHSLDRIVDIFFTPQGIRCDECDESNCRHVKFALGVPQIQKVIRQKRKDGWDLPEI